MKHRNTSLTKRLKQYSLMVSPLIASAEMANSQVIYHDIDPDLVYTDSIIGDVYTIPHFLDLDGDGIFDAEFAVWSSVQSNNGPNKVNLIAARQFGLPGNAMMGYTNLFTASFCSSALPLYCPYAVNENFTIGAAANFWAIPGSTNLGTLGRYFKDLPPPNNFLGQWDDVNDKYLGLRFTGGDGKLHYGWIRMDVQKSPARLTIKDFAFESQNAVPVQAGDQGNVGMAAVNTSPAFSLILDGNILSIELHDGEFKDGVITISNLPGQILLMEPLNSAMTTFDLSQWEKGIYIVTIKRGDSICSQKLPLR